VEGNKGGRSVGAEESRRRRAELKKGNLAVDLALSYSYSWLVVLIITVCVDACLRKNE
jgi:hypothetical protein